MLITFKPCFWLHCTSPGGRGTGSSFKNPAAPAVKREAEEDWVKVKWRRLHIISGKEASLAEAIVPSTRPTSNDPPPRTQTRVRFRPSGTWKDEDYDVLANGKVVGRIYKDGSASTPPELRWFWATRLPAEMATIRRAGFPAFSPCPAPRPLRDPGSSLFG